MNADELFITSSSKYECVPIIESSTAEIPKLNTNIPSDLVFKGKIITKLPGIYILRDNLTSISFPKLTTISGDYALSYTFASCAKLTSVAFPELTTISGNYALYNTFYGCSKLTSISFPKLTTVTYPKNAFSEVGSTSKLAIHFPKALSSLGINIGNTSHFSYGTIYYDL